MQRRLMAAAFLVAALGSFSVSPVEAGSYLFERSYYSHTPERPVVIGHRAPTGGPQFTRPQGVAATSGYRWQNSQTRVGGKVVDQINYWDSWIQVYGKY
jgi:hypothetical protein